MSSEFITANELMTDYGLSKNRVYGLKEDESVKAYLGRPIEWQDEPLRYKKSDIDELKYFFDKNRVQKVVCFIAIKGGVGKTTSSGEVGAILGGMGYKVLLVDLDYNQTNLSMDFMDESEYKGATLYELIKQTKTISEVIHKTRLPNVFLLPSSIRASEFFTGEIKKNILKEKFESLPYDFIIIDTPPYVTETTDWALACSTHALIPIAPDRYSIDGIDTNLKTITMAKHDNPKLKLLGLFTTRMNKGVTTFGMLTDIIEDGTLPFLDIVIPLRQEVIKSRTENKIVYETNPKSDFIKSYTELAKEIING